MKRKYLIILLSLILLINPVFAYDIIYQDQKSEKIHKGLETFELRRFTTEGWVEVHVVKANLKDSDLNFIPLYSNEGLSSRATVPSMLNLKDADAGINADFFYKAEQYSPLGVTIENGNLLTTPADFYREFPSIVVDNNNNISFPIIPWEIGIIHPYGKTKAYSINKTTSEYTVPRIFSTKYNGKTRGNKIPLLEIIVSNNIVTNILNSSQTIDLPPNSYEIVVDLNHIPNELNYINIGDTISIDNGIDNNLLSSQLGLGGGAYLLKDGIIPNFSLNISGKHPRSAVGTDINNNYFYMVTVNGRGKSFRGLEQTEFANLLLELGLYNAINFDGGGSTTLAVKNPYENNYEILNTPSDGNPRRVINGLGLKYDTKVGTISKLNIKVSNNNIFLNTGRTISFYGSDEYGNFYPIDSSLIVTTPIRGNGLFINGRIYPKTLGPLEVNFNYQGISTNYTFNILNPATGLDFNSDFLQFDKDQTIDLNEYFKDIVGINDNGYSAPIEKEDLSFNTYGKIGNINDGLLITTKKQNFGGIAVSVGSAIKNLMVQVGYSETLIDGLDSLDNKSAISYPASVNSRIEISNDFKEGTGALRLFYDFSLTDSSRAAYLKWENPLIINKDTLALAVDVYGNGYGHWLRGKIEDANGKMHVIDFNRYIDYIGFKTEKAELPSSIAYPAKLHRIYLVETNSALKDSGSILLDNLRTLKSAPLGIVSMPKETKALDPLNKIVNNATQTLIFAPPCTNMDTLFKQHLEKTIYSNTSYTFRYGTLNSSLVNEFGNKNINLEQTNNILENSFIRVLSYKSQNGLRRKDANQWTNLLSNLNLEKKPTVIYLNEPLTGQNGFSDPLERQLFEQKLEEYAADSTPVFVITNGDSFDSRIKNKVRYIKMPLDKDVTMDNMTFRKKLILQIDEYENITYKVVDLFK